MATITIPGYIHYSPPLYPGDKDRFSFFSFDATDSHYIVVAPHTITLEAPADWNPDAAHVQALMAAKQKALEEYQSKVASINEQLSKLQCLEAV